MAKIKSPNPKYNGVSASLQFANGEAKTDDKWLIEWFANKGYEVEETEDEEPDKHDLDGLTNDQIRVKLDELEIEYDSSDNKAELIAHYDDYMKEDEGE